MASPPQSRAVALTLVGGLLLAAWPAVAKPRIAVMPLPGDDQAGMVEALRADLEARGQHEVLTKDQTEEKIRGAADLGLSCLPDDVSCLGKLGVLGDVGLILSVLTSTGAEGVSLVLVLIDTEEGKEVRRVSRPFVGSPTALALNALDELLDPASYRGELNVLVAQAGATVKVGDEVWGQSPLGGARALAPGRYQVEVTLGGAKRTQEVTIVKGEAVTLDLNLEDDAAPAATPAPAEVAAPQESGLSSAFAWGMVALAGGAGVALPASTVFTLAGVTGYLDCNPLPETEINLPLCFRDDQNDSQAISTEIRELSLVVAAMGGVFMVVAILVGAAALTGLGAWGIVQLAGEAE